jgi:hypothetical protein
MIHEKVLEQRLQLVVAVSEVSSLTQTLIEEPKCLCYVGEAGVKA